jgi:hypothetical protein
MDKELIRTVSACKLYKGITKDGSHSQVIPPLPLFSIQFVGNKRTLYVYYCTVYNMYMYLAIYGPMIYTARAQCF